ncbi:MAG TPA: histidine kinase [Clostridiales bacterium]|nr:histidine kinase [Clostridiales bacterium]
MFGFSKNRVYRRLFINFSIIFFIVLVALSILAYNQIYRNKYEYIKQNNRRVSEYIEATIRTKQDIIDDKLNSIYNNDKSYNDFISFFMLDIDEYLAKRLDAYQPFDYYPTIAKISQNLIYSDQDIDKIIIFNHIKNRMMVYSTKPSLHLKTYDSSEFLSVPDILQESGGLVLSKEALYPDTMEKICSIFVIYDHSKLLPLIDKYDSGDVIIVDGNGSHTVLNQPVKSRYLKDVMPLLLKQEMVEGEIPITSLSKMHYTSYPIVGQDYKVVTIVDHSIINVDRLTLFAVFASAAVIFILFEIYIANKLSNDASALNSIISTISNAKMGRFTFTKAADRNDEYGLIANELNDMSRKLDNYIKLEYKLKYEQKQMQFELLQNRLNPHFLYNTLETIRARALLNYDNEVANAVSHLGGLYRDLLKFDSVITFSDEIKLTRRYLDLMSFIHGKKFFYTIDVDDEIMDAYTIKFWIQLLVENFFVHGFDRSSDTNVLVVRGFRSPEGRIVIEVCDNGLGMDEKELKRINQGLSTDINEKSGLNNVYKRLKIFYGPDGVSMSVENNQIAGVTVTIELKEVQYVQTLNS